jgi:hypothetical protein
MTTPVPFRRRKLVPRQAAEGLPQLDHEQLSKEVESPDSAP